MKYWILIVDSMNGILTDTIANKEIAYSCKGADKIKAGDFILGYVSSPVSKVRMLLTETQDGTADKLFFEKHLDTDGGCSVDKDIYQKILAAESTDEKYIEITEEEYTVLTQALINGIASQYEELFVEKDIALVDIDGFEHNLTAEQLVQKLNEMYDSAPKDDKSNAVRMFGFKYAENISACGVAPQKLVDDSNINSDNYGNEIKKAMNIYYSIKNNEYGLSFIDKDSTSAKESANTTRVLGGYNKIFYGAPGCGKSFIVNKYLDDAEVLEENRIRVTFHPEYANCDFVGQILPTLEKKIDETTGEEKEIVKYIFNPGPFTLALERALNSNDMVYLVIEEINRGNAAAIFGDLFQLLDRVKDITKPNRGESEYPICNVNIQKYLGLPLKASLVIPSNLTILATMNTSDQNVFTLDTAFKRRWQFEQISNNIEKDNNHEYKGWYVPGTNVTLEKFLTVINAEILRHKITSEDKRMGKYFISKDCLTEKISDIGEQQTKAKAEMFAYKVLEYIWNDVCKIGKDEWFDTTSITTLEDLIDAFVNPDKGISPLSVFKSITF